MKKEGRGGQGMIEQGRAGPRREWTRTEGKERVGQWKAGQGTGW